MSDFAVRYHGEVTTFASYTETELVEWLERYRSESSNDPKFAAISVWEKKGHDSVGAERSVWDFLTNEE